MTDRCGVTCPAEPLESCELRSGHRGDHESGYGEERHRWDDEDVRDWEHWHSVDSLKHCRACGAEHTEEMCCQCHREHSDGSCCAHPLPRDQTP